MAGARNLPRRRGVSGTWPLAEPAPDAAIAMMSADVKYVFEDETTDDLARNMSTLQVRRLPVLNREKRLVGIVSLGDLATADGAADETRDAIAGVSEKVA